MNKVVNINLNGIIITIDEVAYTILKNYIDGLHKHFADTDGSAEIISDIETRIAELLQLKLSLAYTVIQSHDVDEVIAIMGNPWQMDAEAVEADYRQADMNSAYQHQDKKLRRDGRTKMLGGVCSGISNFLNVDSVFVRALFLIAVFIFGTGVLLYLVLWIAIPEAKAGEQPEFNESRSKRLFRNQEDKMLGGVCAGIANYFGIDVVWIRLLFLAGLFFYGSGVLLYMVLWIMIPKAVTAAQKLQMKGEPVDVNNIERVIRNTFSNTTKPAQGILANMISMFAQLCGFLLKTVGKLFALFLLFIAVSIIVASCFGLFYEQEKINAILTSFTITSEVLLFTKLGVACLIISFVLGLVFLGYRLLRTKPIKLRYVDLVNTTLFIAGVILISIAGIKYSNLIKNSQEVIERNIIYPVSDTLYFDVAAQEKEDEVITIQSSRKRKYPGRRRSRTDCNNISIVSANGNHQPLINSQKLRIKPSLTDSIEVKIRKKARGSSVSEAGKIASAISYKINAEGNKLWFNRGILIGNKTGYRYQQAEVTLSVPVGTTIIMNECVVDMMHGIDYDMRKGTTYKVTQDGLTCVDCDKIIYDGRWNDEGESVDINIEMNNSGTTDDKEDKEIKVVIKKQQQTDSNKTMVIESRKKVGPVTIIKNKTIHHKNKE